MSMCMVAYKEGDVFDPRPVADVEENMDTNKLLSMYQIHAEPAVRVDVTKLTPWPYIRKPHKRVINAIKDDMLVSRVSVIPIQSTG